MVEPMNESNLDEARREHKAARLNLRSAECRLREAKEAVRRAQRALEGATIRLNVWQRRTEGTSE